VFLGGTVLMTYNLYMTIKGKRTVQVQPPEVTAYRK
jgi:cbb3-type cytochrome oxidase subunit 1